MVAKMMNVDCPHFELPVQKFYFFCLNIQNHAFYSFIFLLNIWVLLSWGLLTCIIWFIHYPNSSKQLLTSNERNYMAPLIHTDKGRIVKLSSFLQSTASSVYLKKICKFDTMIVNICKLDNLMMNICQFDIMMVQKDPNKKQRNYTKVK